MTKISVIVPVYKVEKYIGECINSILAQTFKNFELILVDDGSPDKSGEICDSYAKKDNRIKVFHKKNGGVSSARNFGIDKAVGEWLCFIDSDDTILPTYLEDFELDKVKSDIYMQGYVKVKESRIIETHDFTKCKESDFANILAYSEDNNIINSPCFKLYKSSIVNTNKVRFDIRTSYGEDHLFSLDYCRYISSAHFTLSHGYNYRISVGESLSHRRIPLDDILFYTRESRKKQTVIIDKLSSDDYLKACNRRLEGNITKMVRELFASTRSYQEYKLILQKCQDIIRNSHLLGLSWTRRMWLWFLGYVNSKLSFLILKTII